MKKQFFLILIVLVFGSLAIFLPGFLSSNNQENKLAQENKVQEQAKNTYMKELTAKPDVIKSSDKTELKQIQGKNKIYFEGIDKLNPFFKANQMEIIKNKIQFYVHSNISNDLLECTLKPETIKRVDNKVSFELTMKNVKKFEAIVTEDKNNEIIDITIFHSL